MGGAIVISVVVFLVLLLFFTPLSVCFSYGSEEGGKVEVKFLVKVFSYPKRGEEKKKKAAPPKDKARKEEKAEKKDKKDIGEIISLVKDLIPVLTSFCRHITVKEIDIYVKHGTGDAAKTAIEYGEINAGIYSALALLKNAFRVKKQHLNIVPDFSEEKTEYLINGKAYVFGIYVLISAVSAVKVFLQNASEKE